MNIEKKIIEVMNQVGIFVDVGIDSNNDDINLRDYIFNSFQFISFVLELENCFNIALPDQYLQIDNFSSLKSLALNIEELINTSNTKQITNDRLSSELIL